MAVPVRSELIVEIESLARRTFVCWHRGQEGRRNELRAARARAALAERGARHPAAAAGCAAAHLPRGLRANTHAHFRRFAGVSSRLTVRVLRGQVAQARHRLIVSGERLTLSARSLLRSRGDRYVGLGARLKASKLAYAQAKRQAIARERERTHRLTERARRALVTALQRLDARVNHSGQLLTALSYRSVLARGFALVRDEPGACRPCRRSVGRSAPLAIEFRDGRVGVSGGCGSAGRDGAAAIRQSPARRRRLRRSDGRSLFSAMRRFLILPWRGRVDANEMSGGVG